MDDDHFPVAPAPFVSRFEFAGCFKAGAQSTKPLEVIVDIDQLGRSTARGFVIGTPDVGVELEQFVEAHPDLTLEPAREGLVPRISGSQAIIRDFNISGSGSQPEGGFHRVVARFDCRQIRHELPLRPGETSLGPPEVSFDLNGDLPRLGVVVRPISVTAPARSLTDGGSEIPLPAALGWKVVVRAEYVDASGDEEERLSRVRIALGAQRLTGEVAPYSAREVEDASQLIDDLLLVISLIKGRRVSWFARHHAGSSALVADFRHVGMREVQSERRDPLFRPGAEKEFLPVAVVSMRELRARGVDLTMPLSMVIASREEMYAEQRFTTVFSALENLKAQLGRDRSLSKIVADVAFAPMRASIETCLEGLAAGGADREVISSLKSRIGELNRRAFWTAFDVILKEREVDWTDLYPPREGRTTPSFVRTRNDLLHSSRVPPLDELWFETERARAVLERLIMKLLGWKDVSWIPGRIHSLLRESEG